MYWKYIISDYNTCTQISNNFITHGKQSSYNLVEGVGTLSRAAGTAFKSSKIYLKY